MYLWNDCKFGPQVMQANLRYLNIIDGDLAFSGFQQTEEAERHG